MIGRAIETETHEHTSAYIKQSDEYSSGMYFYVLKGVSSRRDAGNCLTKFRIDVSSRSDTHCLKSLAHAEPLKTIGVCQNIHI